MALKRQRSIPRENSLKAVAMLIMMMRVTPSCAFVSQHIRFLANALPTSPFVSKEAYVFGFKVGTSFGGDEYHCQIPMKMTGNENEFESESMDDDQLLKTVAKSQLEELCQQLNLSTKGTKVDLLQRLRKHANEQAEIETQRRRQRAIRVEEGGTGEARERYEIVEGNNYFEQDFQEEDEEDHGYFFFELPRGSSSASKEINDKKEICGKTSAGAANGDSGSTEKEEEMKKKRPAFVTQSDIVGAPPPPEDADLNENGERVVTVYSTTDQNDLTGVAAAQPGQAAISGSDAMASGPGPRQPQPWDLENGRTKSASSKEIDLAKEKVTELVQTLLAMSGAPGFRDYDMPEELEDIMDDVDAQGDYLLSSYNQDAGPAGTPGFIGFDPSKVPAHILTEMSQALRANRGKVLQEVLRDFELHAVGQDGMNGDDVENGGGHFKEVSKVRAFLEGYRRAEVRKSARVTVTFLLDKLVSEGIDGLDMTLATMSRSSDDSANDDDAYELNDSLISYLSDVIRQQERKVDQLRSKGLDDNTSRSPTFAIQAQDNDPVDLLWNRTTGEDGEKIETIDPNDKRVRQVLQEEYEKTEAAVAVGTGTDRSIPETAPEKLLLLLTLLWERIKTEAAFPNDERTRNLRLLAYCLQCKNNAQREELIVNNLGKSIDVSLKL